MALNDLLFHVVDIAYLQASSLADGLSTYYCLNKNPKLIEENVNTNQQIEEHGVSKGLVNVVKKELILAIPCFAAFYGIDAVFGIENNNVNFHHALTYGVGTLKFMAVGNNLAFVHKKRNVALVIGFFPRKYQHFIDDYVVPQIKMYKEKL